jgi:hypothetical protein
MQVNIAKCVARFMPTNWPDIQIPTVIFGLLFGYRNGTQIKDEELNSIKKEPYSVERTLLVKFIPNKKINLVEINKYTMSLIFR